MSPPRAGAGINVTSLLQSALMLSSTVLTRTASQADPELDTLVHRERLRMLMAPTLPVALVSAVFAVALGMLIAPVCGTDRTAAWVALCLLASGLRVALATAWSQRAQPNSAGWLHALTAGCLFHGLVWGLAGAWLAPVHDLVTSAVILAVLVGACAVSTFTMQAHMLPNLAANLPMLLPAAAAIAMRGDRYGAFGGLGLVALLALMLFESRRAERRITELLRLRFTTDRIARERAEALKLAWRHSAVKDQFLATMSHEMRTPLHGILGLAGLIRQRLPQRPGVLTECRQQAELIEHAGEHLLTLINDVLDFSRIEAGHLHIERAPFDLGTVVHEVLGLLRVTAQDKGIALRARVALPAPCWVEGDAARVRQVLHNLVGNAIKFTDQGEVTVRVTRQGGGTQAGMVFSVQDTGVGISADQIGLIFEAFHQADGSFGRRHKGTGLGLTISRELARAMGGDITCVSAPGKGSTFEFTAPLPPADVVSVDVPLPMDDGADAAASPDTLPLVDFGDTAPVDVPIEPDTTARPGRRVLLAEDNPVNAMVAEATLHAMGLHVTHVEDGAAALAVLTRLPRSIDLVLMDCQMPQMDGLEATRRLRDWEARHDVPRMPVVALTANAMSGDRARCLAAGMDDHLPKPFRQVELQAVLMRQLEADEPQRLIA